MGLLLWGFRTQTTKAKARAAEQAAAAAASWKGVDRPFRGGGFEVSFKMNPGQCNACSCAHACHVDLGFYLGSGRFG